MVYAESAVVVDGESGRVLWSRNPDKKMFPASITKIMTALLLLENTKPDQSLVAPSIVTTIPESSFHLAPGEILSAHDAGYALMLRSANDVAMMIALTLGKTQEGFAAMMNERAKKIGCKNTSFVNPNGLHDDNHYTTANDFALIAREAMSNSDFRAIAATKSWTTIRTSGSKDLLVESKNKVLTLDSTCEGIKTGFTNQSGKTFVGANSRNGWRTITVILKSPNWEQDHKNLVDWAFKNFEQVPVTSGFEVVSAVVGKNRVSVGTTVEGISRIALRKDGSEKIETKRVLSKDILATKAGEQAPMTVEEKLLTEPVGQTAKPPVSLTPAGEFQVLVNGSVVAQRPLMKASEVKVSSAEVKAKRDFSWLAIVLGMVAVGVAGLAVLRRGTTE